MALSLVTAATFEPIALAEAKTQCRIAVDVTNEDALVAKILIPAARERGEQATRRQFLEATWDYKLEGFPCGEVIEIPLPPLREIVSISYVDTAGATQIWAASNYVVDAPTGPKAARGRVALAYNVSWPTTRAQLNAVTIRFKAGYGTTAIAVPARLRQAMLQDIGTMFEHREEAVVGQGYTISEFPRGAAAVYRSFQSY